MKRLSAVLVALAAASSAAFSVQHAPKVGARRALRLVARVWVLTEEGRASRLGRELDCERCDEEEGAD